MRDLNITEKLFRYRDEADILFGCSALTLSVARRAVFFSILCCRIHNSHSDTRLK